MVQIRLDHSPAISLCFYISTMSLLGQSTFTTLAVLVLWLISLILFNSLDFRDVGCRGSPATRSATCSTLYRALCRLFRSSIGSPTSGSSRTEFRYPTIMVSDQSDSTIKMHRRLHCRHRNRRWAQSGKNRIFSYYWVPQSGSASSSDPEAGCCTTRPTLPHPPRPHFSTIF